MHDSSYIATKIYKFYFEYTENLYLKLLSIISLNDGMLAICIYIIMA